MRGWAEFVLGRTIVMIVIMRYRIFFIEEMKGAKVGRFLYVRIAGFL
ncbi:hypothetical protein J2129_001177 [Methanofollis sp. W23]|nr:hypothetical protein [Methanofollis sp. W23]MBP2145723.1 hypothetical protein [Methanofollis sp. W23]